MIELILTVCLKGEDSLIRLLIYNWIPFDEDGLKGGGVTVYTRSLISCLCKNPEYVNYLQRCIDWRMNNDR